MFQLFYKVILFVKRLVWENEAGGITRSLRAAWPTLWIQGQQDPTSPAALPKIRKERERLAISELKLENLWYLKTKNMYGDDRNVHKFAESTGGLRFRDKPNKMPLIPSADQAPMEV